MCLQIDIKNDSNACVTSTLLQLQHYQQHHSMRVCPAQFCEKGSVYQSQLSAEHTDVTDMIGPYMVEQNTLAAGSKSVLLIDHLTTLFVKSEHYCIGSGSTVYKHHG
jgi:hypothetical protein